MLKRSLLFGLAISIAIVPLVVAFDMLVKDEALVDGLRHGVSLGALGFPLWSLGEYLRLRRTERST
jgi:hypothetical protein